MLGRLIAASLARCSPLRGYDPSGGGIMRLGKVQRVPRGEAERHLPIASDSSLLANKMGGTANLPGPRSEPAVSELWTFWGSNRA